MASIDEILAGADIDAQLAEYTPDTSSAATDKLKQLQQAGKNKLQRLNGTSEEPDADSNAQWRIQGGDSAEVAHDIIPTGDTNNERSKVYKQVAYMNNIPISEAVKQVDSEFPAVKVDPNLPGLIAKFRKSGDIPKTFNMTSWDVYNAGNKDYQAALKDKALHPKTAFDNYVPFDTGKQDYFGRELSDNRAYVNRQIAEGHMTPGSDNFTEYLKQLKSYENAKVNGLGDFGNSVDPRVMDAILKTSYNYKHFNMADHQNIDPTNSKQVPMSNILSTLRQRESSNDYSKINKKFGYIGAYQFGASRLIDLGLVKKGAKNSDLNNPDAWTGKYGVKNEQDFLSNPKLQDAVATRHIIDLKNKLSGSSTSQADLIGKVFAAHLLGLQGSKNLSTSDGLGTTGLEYYKLGSELANSINSNQKHLSTTSNRTFLEKLQAIPKQLLAGAIQRGYDESDSTVELIGNVLGRTLDTLGYKKQGKWADKNFDLGDEAYKAEVVHQLVGQDTSRTAEARAKVSKYYANMMKDVSFWDPSTWSKINSKYILPIAKTAFMNTDMTANTVGWMLGSVYGLIAKGGRKLVKAGMEDFVKKTTELNVKLATKQITKKEFKQGLKTATKALPVKTRIKLYVADHANELSMAVGMNNDQLDSVIANNGGNRPTLIRAMVGTAANYAGAKVNLGSMKFAVKGGNTWVSKTLANMGKKTATRFMGKLLSETSKIGAAGLGGVVQGTTFTFISEFNRLYGTNVKNPITGEVTTVDAKQAAEEARSKAAESGLEMGFSMSSLAIPHIAHDVGIKSLGKLPQALIDLKAKRDASKIMKAKEEAGTVIRDDHMAEDAIKVVNNSIVNLNELAKSEPIAGTVDKQFKEFDTEKQYSKEDIKNIAQDMLLNPEQYKDTATKQKFVVNHIDIFNEVAKDLVNSFSDKPTKENIDTKIDTIEKFSQHIPDVISGKTEVNKDLLKNVENIIGVKNINETLKKAKSSDTEIKNEAIAELKDIGSKMEDVINPKTDTKTIDNSSILEQFSKHIIDVRDNNVKVDKELIGKVEDITGSTNLGKTIENLHSNDHTVVDKANSELANVIQKGQEALNNELDTTKTIEKDSAINEANKIIDNSQHGDSQKAVMKSAVQRIVYGFGAGIKVALADWKTDKQLELDDTLKNNVSTTDTVNKKHKRLLALSDRALEDIAVRGDVSSLDSLREKDSKLEGDTIQILDNASEDLKGVKQVFQKTAATLNKFIADSKNGKTGIKVIDNADPKDKSSVAFRLLATAINQIQSSTISSMHEAVNDGAKQMPDGTALYKVANQIGKDYIHSYGLQLTGSPKANAEAYTKIGEQAIELATKLGIANTDVGNIYNTKDIRDYESGKSVNASDLGLETQNEIGTNNVVTRGPIIRLADTDLSKNITSDDIKNLVSPTAEAFKKLKPLLNAGNAELPRKEAFGKDYVVTTDKDSLSKVEEDAVLHLMNKPLHTDEHMYGIFDYWVAKYKKAIANGKTITKFVADNPGISTFLNLENAKGHNFLSESINGANWAKMQNFRDIADNWEYLKKDPLFFEYKIDINERASLINNILNMQHDKVMARHMVNSNKNTTISASSNPEQLNKELKFAVNNIANEFKQLGKGKEAITAILHSGVNDKLDALLKALDYSNVQDTIDAIAVSMQHPGELLYGMKSGFKALTILHAIKDIRAGGFKDGKLANDIKTNYMFNADAQASGVMNTLINVIGLSRNEKELNTLVEQLRSFGVYLDGKRPKLNEETGKLAYKDPYNMVMDTVKNRELKEIQETLKAIQGTDLDTRDLAKIPIVSWFYGQESKNVRKAIGQDAATRVFKIAVGISHGNAVKSAELIRSIFKGKNVDITNMTESEFNIMSEYFSKKLGKPITQALDELFPQVVRYRELMNQRTGSVLSSNDPGYNERQGGTHNVYTALTGWFGKLWHGQFPGAVTPMLNSDLKAGSKDKLTPEQIMNDKGSYMSVHKKRNILLKASFRKEGSGKQKLPLIGTFRMKNKTSLAVNGQHSSDAALLFHSIRDITDSLITVHDDVRGPLQDVMKAINEYNNGYLKLPKLYDYLDEAVKLLKKLNSETKLEGQDKVAFQKFIADLETITKQSLAVKNKLITDKSKAEIFGLKDAQMHDIDGDVVEARKVYEEQNKNVEAYKPVETPFSRWERAEKNIHASPRDEKGNTTNEHIKDITKPGQTYVVLDTETTGFDAHRYKQNGYTGHVWEIGAIKYKDGKQVGEPFKILFNKDKLFTENGKDLKNYTTNADKTKFNADVPWFGDEQVAEYVRENRDKFIDLTSAKEALKKFIGDHNIIMKNAKFDVSALQHTFSDEGIIDAKKVYDYDRKGLDKLIKERDAEENANTKNSNGITHTAVSDVKDTHYFMNKDGLINNKKDVKSTHSESVNTKNAFNKLHNKVKGIKTFIELKKLLTNIVDTGNYKIDNEHRTMLKNVLSYYSSPNNKKLPDIKLGNEFHYSYDTKGKRTITFDKKAKDVINNNENIIDSNRLVELMLHEIEHDLTSSYIQQEAKKGTKASHEYKYMKRVIKELENKFESAKVSSNVAERINYILKGDPLKSDKSAEQKTARQVTELTAVLRSEPAFAKEISNLLYSTSTPKRSFMRKLIETAKRLIEQGIKFSSNAQLNFDNTAHALEVFRQGINIDSTEATSSGAGVSNLANRSIIGEIDKKARKVLKNTIFTTSDTVVGPLVKKAHEYLYTNVSTYKGVTNLLKHGLWDGEFMQQLRTSLNMDETIPDKLYHRLLSMSGEIETKSYQILADDIPKLRDGINTTFKNKDHQTLITKVFGKTGIAHILVNKEVENMLLNAKSIDDVLANYKLTKENKAYAEDLANFYITGNIGKSGIANSQRILFNKKSGTTAEQFNQYVALLALKKIPNSLDIIKKAAENKDLYNSLKQTVLQVKATSDLVSGLSGNVTRVGYDDFDGNYTLDISKKPLEYKLVKPGIKNQVRMLDSVWKKVKTGNGSSYDLYVRELDEGYKKKGIGISKNRYTNGQKLSKDWVEEQIKLDPDFTLNNNISTTLVNGVPNYRLHIPESAKGDNYVTNDLSESLFRTLVHNKELIETESLKDIIRQQAIMKVNKSNIDALVLDIRRRKLGKKVNKPIPMFIKFDEADLGDNYAIPMEIKKMYGTKYFKNKNNEKQLRVSTFNDFDKSFDFIRKDMKHILLDSNPNNIFPLGSTGRKIENIYRHMVSMKKIRLISNPGKLMGDAAANSVLLADVPIATMAKYSKEYVDGMDKLTALRNKQIELELQALTDPTVKPRLVRINKKIKSSTLYPALKYGFLQSISTGMVLKDFESIRGLQEDMNIVLDKLLNINDKEKTWLGNIFSYMSKAGFQGEDILAFLSKKVSKKSSIIGDELKAMSDRLSNIKKEDDMVRYVGEILGSPSSEIVRQSSNIMVNIDGVSRWILYNHLRNTGVAEFPAAKEALDTFIDYRVKLPEEIQLMSDLGIMLFPNFWMKYQKVILNLAKKHPVSSSVGYTLDNLMGVSSAHPFKANIASKLVNGSVFSVVDPTDSMIYNPYWWLFK